MDREAGIKFQKKGKEKDSKERTKVQKHRSAIWHGSEEQTNICLPYVTIMWCLKLVATQRHVKMKLIFLASKELSRL